MVAGHPFSELELLGLTSAFGIGVFVVCFIIFFFFVHPYHERLPSQQPLMHSVSTVGLMGTHAPRGVFSFMRRLDPRFMFLEDTAMTSASSLGNVSLRNYLNFLNCVGNIFALLSIPALFFVWPLECCLGKSLEFGQNSVSTNFTLTSASGRTSVWILYVLTWGYSYVALKHISYYCSRLQAAVVRQEAALREVQSRTVVLRGIPVRERSDSCLMSGRVFKLNSLLLCRWGSLFSGKMFKLRARAVLKAEEHLKEELSRQATKSSGSDFTANSEPSATVSAIHLVVTQDRIDDLRAAVSLCEGRYAHYSNIVSRYPRLDWYYKWRKTRYEKALSLCKTKIQRLVNDYQFAGLAVVTFASRKDTEALLDKRYFSFGMPPFASVSLLVRKAPYRDDIIWNNVHISGWMRAFAKFFLIAILFVLTVAFVTPVAIAQDLVPVTKTLRKFKDTIHMTDAEFFVWTQYLPVVVILATNSLVIPYVVYWISRLIRPQLKTDQEMTKLSLNLFFSLLTTVIIPLLGLDSLGALLKWFANSHEVSQIQVLIGSVFLKSSGIFTLRYLINSAFLTSSSQLLQCGQVCYRRILLMFWAVTYEEKQQARQPWVFEWGYSYAFALTVMFQAMIFSVTVPLTAPLTAIYFKMKYFVDKYNMQYGVFTIDNEFCHLSPSVAQVMINAVALMQFVMSAFFFVQLEVPRSANDDAQTYSGLNDTIQTTTASMPYVLVSEPSLPGLTKIVFGEFQVAAMPLLASSVLLFAWGFKKKHDVARTLENDVPIVPARGKSGSTLQQLPYDDASAYCPPYRPEIPVGSNDRASFADTLPGGPSLTLR